MLLLVVFSDADQANLKLAIDVIKTIRRVPNMVRSKAGKIKHSGQNFKDQLQSVEKCTMDPPLTKQ